LKLHPDASLKQPATHNCVCMRLKWVDNPLHNLLDNLLDELMTTSDVFLPAD